jgi:hypothetical protein
MFLLQPTENLCFLESKKVYYEQRTTKKIRIYVFPEKELRGLSPDFHIHVSVSDLYVYSHIRPTYFLAAK